MTARSSRKWWRRGPRKPEKTVDVCRLCGRTDCFSIPREEPGRLGGNELSEPEKDLRTGELILYHRRDLGTIIWRPRESEMVFTQSDCSTELVQTAEFLLDQAQQRADEMNQAAEKAEQGGKGMKVKHLKEPGTTVLIRDIPIGTVFTASLLGGSTFLRTYNAVVDLVSPNNVWMLDAAGGLEVHDYREVEVELVVKGPAEEVGT